MSENKVAFPNYMYVIIVKEAHTAKLSLGSEVKITYQLALSNDKKHIFISLIGSGSQGYFSHEWINADLIIDILGELSERADAFTSKVFRSVFVGRSSNNAPFLAAALLAEKLLDRDGKYETRLRAIKDGAGWKKALLTLKGKPIQVRLDGKPITTPLCANEPSAKGKDEDDEDDGHDSDSPE